MSAMWSVARANALAAASYYIGARDQFVDEVLAAATYHDLGKLDKENQRVLGVESWQPLPIRHEDAGVAELIQLKRRESVILAQAHHQGLFSNETERAKPKNKGFRFPVVADYVDGHLAAYIAEHSQAGCPVYDQLTRPLPRAVFGEELRSHVLLMPITATRRSTMEMSRRLNLSLLAGRIDSIPLMLMSRLCPGRVRHGTNCETRSTVRAGQQIRYHPCGPATRRWEVARPPLSWHICFRSLRNVSCATYSWFFPT